MVGAAWMAAHTTSCKAAKSVFAPAILYGGREPHRRWAYEVGCVGRMRYFDAYGGRSVGVQRRFAAHVVLPLSERGMSLYRTARTDCCFRAHSNLWWARHGWPLIQPVARPQSQFSRPPYFTAGVNLTAENPSEPPRGGEHGAGDDCLNRNSPFAESRNC